MDKKVCIITGANSGIGKQAAIQILDKEYHVILACRNKRRGEDALKDMKSLSSAYSAELVIVDMGLQESVRNFAAAMKEKYNKVDVLIYNAAIFNVTQKKQEKTAEGIETVWSVNHLGPVLLTDPKKGIKNDIFDMFKIQAKISIDFAKKYPKYHLMGIMFAKEKGTKLFKDAIKDLGRNDEAGLTQLIGKAIKNNEFNKRFSKKFIEILITHLFLSFYELFLENEESDKAAYKHLDDYIDFMRNGLSSHGYE